MESRPAKVRGTFLPNEYLLANFIRGIENPHPSWTTDTPACKWMGAYCYIENEVHALIWTELKLQGTVEWKHLPSTLRNLGLQRNKLRGEVDFSVLPEALTKMLIGNNLFSGALCFENFPPFLTVLDLSNCCFSGHVDLAILQERDFGAFNLTNNPELTGTVKGKLPLHLQEGIPLAWQGLKPPPKLVASKSKVKKLTLRKI